MFPKFVRCGVLHAAGCSVFSRIKCLTVTGGYSCMTVWVVSPRASSSTCVFLEAAVIATHLQWPSLHILLYAALRGNFTRIVKCVAPFRLPVIELCYGTLEICNSDLQMECTKTIFALIFPKARKRRGDPFPQRKKFRRMCITSYNSTTITYSL